MLVEYHSNNSGGHWWLKESDWLALEKSGWNVQWGTLEVKCSSLEEAKEKGAIWLGTYAKYATKEFNSIKEAKKDFSDATGLNVNAKGCPCCGRPHNFYEA